MSSNREQLLGRINEILKKEAEIKLGGGRSRMESEHSKGKLTARERIDHLMDPGSTFLEIGLWAGDGMYVDVGGCPSAGVITGIIEVHGRKCMVVANDATVKAGAWFPITAKKNLRAQEIAMENRIPLIYLVDSAGVYLPMQDEIFPDKEHFGRIFRNNAKISAMGIPQIAAIMGSCVAGGAYLPIMSDEALIVDGTGSVFLAGSYLVKAAIGEQVDNETLGGSITHTEISGVTDYRMPDDPTCLATIRELIDRLGPIKKSNLNKDVSSAPAFPSDTIFDVFPFDRSKPYDIRKVIDTFVDANSLVEFKKGYGQTIFTAYARIDGYSVGIVANQRTIVKTKTGEMQIGGVIYSDSADKATRFILNCNQKKIPLLFIQDVTGFMVGKRSEHGGIIKDGAKMVNAVANSTVPKITLIIGNSYGAGNYAMCGKAYDPRFIFAWPSAHIAVMGGQQAASTLFQIEKASMEKKGIMLSPEQEKEFINSIRDKYEAQTDVRYAAARLWVDAIIDPVHTREFLSNSLASCDYEGYIDQFNNGVIQV